MRRPGAIWREITKNLGRKPATVRYPKQRLPLPDNFRGKPVFDPKGCVGCLMCVRDCPARAIQIDKIAEKTFACTFYLDRCIFCGQCADSCPRKTIHMSHDYELASFDRDGLIDRRKDESPRESAEAPPGKDKECPPGS